MTIAPVESQLSNVLVHTEKTEVINQQQGLPSPKAQAYPKPLADNGLGDYPTTGGEGTNSHNGLDNKLINSPSNGPLSGYSPIGDTIALANLAYNVYAKVFAVGKIAPEQMGELSQDLRIYRVVLFRIRDQARNQVGSDYDIRVRDMLDMSFQTLREIRLLTIKYECISKHDLKANIHNDVSTLIHRKVKACVGYGSDAFSGPKTEPP